MLKLTMYGTITEGLSTMIQPWLEAFCILIIVIIGFVLGIKISRLPKRYWVGGYVFALSLLMLTELFGRIPRLDLCTPFRWLAAGRNYYAILSFAIPISFGIIIPHVPQKKLKVLLSIFMILACFYCSALPFLGPALLQNYFSNLRSHIYDKVCIQSTSYTCGAAAAVTALMQFGIGAEEGEIAIISRTRPLQGTSCDMLSKAIQHRYAGAGIKCYHRYFDSIDQLKPLCPTIVVVKLSCFIDHYVTVLEISDSYIIVGDPLHGPKKLTHDEFKKKWRYSGIVVQKL